jgi:hypothetical protein
VHLDTHLGEKTVGHKTDNKQRHNKAKLKRNFLQSGSDDRLFIDNPYSALMALKSTHSQYLGFYSTLDYYRYGTVPKTLHILQTDKSRYEPFTVTSFNYQFTLYIDRYNEVHDDYSEYISPNYNPLRSKYTLRQNDSVYVTIPPLEKKETIEPVNQLKQNKTCSTTDTTSTCPSYPDIPPGLESKDEVIDFSQDNSESEPVVKPVNQFKKNLTYEKSFKPNYTKIAQDYNKNKDTVINFEHKEETKALNILRNNDALAQEPPNKPPSIDNYKMNPHGFSYETLNGTINRKRNIFDKSLYSIQIAIIILFITLVCILDYMYNTSGIDLRPFYIFVIIPLFSHITFSIAYLHLPLLATPGWYFDYAETFIPQSLTHVEVEYVGHSCIPAARDEPEVIGADSRPVMTRAGKIDHNDPQIWDVKLTESYLVQDTSWKGRFRQWFIGRIRYFTRLKITNIKVSLELLANIMALKTLNRDDPIDVLRVKIKQSMGNINCINIPRYYSIQNEFIQSNTLDVALHQLRSLRDGQDFQHSL